MKNGGKKSKSYKSYNPHSNSYKTKMKMQTYTMISKNAMLVKKYN